MAGEEPWRRHHQRHLPDRRGKILPSCPHCGLIRTQLALIYANIKTFYYDLLCKTVDELEMGRQEHVVAIKTTDTYWDAFQRMNRHVRNG